MSQELDQMRVRREKMEELKQAGIEPFGRRFKRDHLAQQIRDEYGQFDKEELNDKGAMVIIAGRMTRKRSSGKAGFADFVPRPYVHCQTSGKGLLTQRPSTGSVTWT